MLYEKRYCLELKRTKGRTRTLWVLRAFHPTASQPCMPLDHKYTKRNITRGRVNFPRHRTEAAKQIVPWLKPQRERETMNTLVPELGLE